MHISIEALTRLPLSRRDVVGTINELVQSMKEPNPLQVHRITTRKLAAALRPKDVYDWLTQYGYFPESYVLPPCFAVVKRPPKPAAFFHVKPNKASAVYTLPRKDCIKVHFPKTRLTDRTFGLIHPEIHNDIAFHLAQNWKTIVKAMIPKDSRVVLPANLDSQGLVF